MRTRQQRLRHTTPARRTPRRARLHTTAQAAIVAAPTVPAASIHLRAKIAAGGLILFVVAFLALTFNVDWFYVYDFEVAGNQILNEAEIARASGVYAYNIFFVDSARVEKLLQRLPEVKSARVRTGLFNRVAVEIEERQPTLTWLRGNEVYWVDGDGIAIAARANRADLPVLRDLDAAPVKPGFNAPTKPFEALRALQVAMPEVPRLFEWSSTRGIAFTDERGWKIYLGDAKEMLGKVAILRALLAQLRTRNASIHFVDVGQGDPFYQ